MPHRQRATPLARAASLAAPAALALGICLWGAASRAQDAPLATPIPAAATELARSQLAAGGYDRVARAVSAAEQAVDATRLSSLREPDKARAREAIDAEFRKSYPAEAFEAAYAKAIAAAFTRAEIDQVAAFYRSPAGQKVLRVSGALADRQENAAETLVGASFADFHERCRLHLDQLSQYQPR